MSADPRLTNVQLLTLAAFRLQQRRQHHVPDWRQSEGLSALLDAARSLPRRDDPWDLSGVDTTCGLGKLLAEARLKGAGDGA
jgi:hypothetical protein